jgi:hypothetical protein
MNPSVFLFSMVFLLLSTADLKAQEKLLTQSEKQTLTNNCSKIMADVKNDFKVIRVGEMKDWAGKKIWNSTVRLLPAYTPDDTYTIVYSEETQTKIVKVNYYQELLPFSLSEISSALLSTLKAKGCVEVTPQRLHEADIVRAFRSQDAVVELRQNKNATPAEVSVTIGKLYYYYGQDVAVIKTATTPVQKPETKTVSKPGPPKNPLPDTVSAIRYPFTYEHPCGFKAVGQFVSGDTLIDGRILSHCNAYPYFYSSFTGTYLKNGNMWWNFKPEMGVLELKQWGAVFAGDFINEPKGPKDDYTIWAKGYLKVGGDSLYGYLHSTTNLEPKYYLTPMDKNKRRVKLYYDRNNTKKPEVVYEENTVAEEEKMWAEAEEKLKRRQTYGTGSGTGSTTVSPASAAMIADADAARAKLYNDIATIDRNMERDMKDCLKDAAYGPSIVRMSKSCQRVSKYSIQLSTICNQYLAKYAAYTGSGHIRDIKDRIFQAGEMLTILSR